MCEAENLHLLPADPICCRHVICLLNQIEGQGLRRTASISPTVLISFQLLFTEQPLGAHSHLSNIQTVNSVLFCFFVPVHKAHKDYTHIVFFCCFFFNSTSRSKQFNRRVGSLKILCAFLCCDMLTTLRDS